MNVIWFIGLPMSIPIGLILSIGYVFVRSFFSTLTSEFHLIAPTKTDFLIIAIILAGSIFFIFMKNISRKLSGQTDFRPLRGRTASSLSRDKQQAQNKPVPKQYLSKIPDGLTIGRYGNKFVRIPFLESPEHQLIFGSPGSKKSNIIKNGLLHVLNYESPVSAVLAVDVKPELSRECVYEGRKDVKIINPSTIDRTRYGFNVFYGLSDTSSDDELKERCSMIARTLIINQGGDNEFFSVSAQNILTSAIMFCFRKNLCFGESILKVMESPTEDLIAEILTDAEMEAHPKIRRLVSEFDGKTSDGFQDIAITLRQELSIFDVDSVQHCFSQDNPRMASPEDLANGISLFIAIPDHLQKHYRCVFRLIIQLCLSHLMSLPEWTRRDKGIVWFLIDEAGSIGSIPDLLEVLSKGRSKRIMLTLIGQSYYQFVSTYKEAGATTIEDCVKTTIVLSCHNTKTAKAFSDKCGMYRETKVATTKQTSMMTASSTNESVEYRPVLDVSDVEALERDEKVLCFAKGDWFLVDKAPYYSIKEHKELSDKIVDRNRLFYSDDN